jgi:CTD kinase subunit beta
MLEASGFDYRNRYPQKYLFKLAKQCRLDRDVVRTAYKMMLDLYRTFAPLKLASATMAFVCLELSARVLNKQLDNVRNEHESRNNKWKVPRAQVIEGILDLLDLYTHFQRGTIVGPAYSIDHFISIRLAVNEEAKTQKCPRYSEWIEKRQNGVKSSIKTPKTPITPASPSDTRANGNANASPATLSPRSSGSGRKGVGARGQEGTVRFMLDAAQAKKEKETVAEYFKIEYEDYEIEIDEPVRAAPVNDDRPRRDDRGVRNGNGRHDRYDRHDRDFKRPRR